MNLQNGYKVLYAEAADGYRTYKASKTGAFADAIKIGDAIEIGKYKLIYEKNGKIYGSETGVPAEKVEDDTCFNFDAIFAVEEPGEASVASVEDDEEVPAPVVEVPEADGNDNATGDEEEPVIEEE